jgi:hypothetical protein
MVAEVVGNVIVVLSVPVKVRVFWKVSVFPAVPVSVYVPVVKVLPLIVVAVAAPREGVVKEGLVVAVRAPDPFRAWPRAVRTPVPNVIAACAPIVLYEIVWADEPLKVVPLAAPEPLLFIVREFVVVPDTAALIVPPDIVTVVPSTFTPPSTDVDAVGREYAAEYAPVPSVPPVPTLSVDPSVPENVSVLVAFNVLALVTVTEPAYGVIAAHEVRFAANG